MLTLGGEVAFARPSFDPAPWFLNVLSFDNPMEFTGSSKGVGELVGLRWRQSPYRQV